MFINHNAKKLRTIKDKSHRAAVNQHVQRVWLQKRKPENQKVTELDHLDQPANSSNLQQAGVDDFINIRPDKKLGVSEHSQQSQQSHANGAMFEKFIWLRYMGCLKPACESIREPMREPAREPTRGRRALKSCERVRWSSGVIRGRVVWLAETGRPRNEDWVDCVFHLSSETETCCG